MTNYKIISKLQKHSSSNVIISSSTRPTYNINGQEYNWLEMINALSKSYQYIVSKQLADLEKFPSQRVYFTKYEEFTQDFPHILRAIDHKMGLDSTKRQWEHIPVKLEDRNNKFQELFDSTEIQIINKNCFPLLQKLNYSYV